MTAEAWRAAIRGDAPCPVCGRSTTRKGRRIRHLGQHAAQAHGMTRLDVRNAAELRMCDATCEPETSARMAHGAPPRPQPGHGRRPANVPERTRAAMIARARGLVAIRHARRESELERIRSEAARKGWETRRSRSSST